MNEHKNMILAVALSALVILGWGFISEIWFPTANPPVTKVEKGRSVPVAQPQVDPAADTPAALRDRRIVLAETPRIRIETPRLSGSISLKGARVDDLVLTTQREGIGPNSPPVRIFSPAGTRDAYFGSFGWAGPSAGSGGIRLPDGNTVWQASGTRLTPATPVTLRWDNGQGQLFQIALSIDDGYLIQARQTVGNRGAGAIAVRPYAFVSRIGASRDPDSWTNHVGPMGVFNGAANYDNNYSEIAESGAQHFTSRGGWIGFTDKYWLAAVIPGQSGTVDAEMVHNAQTNSFQTQFVAAAEIVPPGAAATYTSHLFAGAKEIHLLDTYSEALGTPLERAIDWGWFRWFMQAIYALLTWLFAMTGNFGVAIILLTVIVRLLLFPIAQRQFKSMAAMRVLQPKMKALQERHKEDRAKLQEEMIKLYKEEKVNPMAGCLPIFLQIPVFYALYKVLLLVVEMRHQPFALWIHDLSSPDPMSPVNLFGYLPFHPPGFLAIGVLPILLGITMWLQMRLNPPAADPVQQQVVALMPWILMVIMSSFAAGLQLYWVTNNILTIAQQRLLYARYPGMRASMNAGVSGGPAPSPPPATGGGRKPKPR